MRLRHTRCAREKGGELFECEGEQYFTHTENCNSWDQQTCPSPCEGYECMDFGACVDVSTAEDPIAVSSRDAVERIVVLSGFRKYLIKLMTGV